MTIHSGHASNKTGDKITDKNLYAVIMAGGVGSRLWPLSRKKMPKQFLDFFGDGTMIAKTIERLHGLVPVENIFIVTNKSGKAIIRKQLPAIKSRNIIVEPVGRNTAPCIALATCFIQKQNPDATMVVLPADHLIQNIDLFQRTLAAAIETANKTNALVTLGIKPTRPETGYGYIQSQEGDPELAAAISVRFGINAHRVKTFAEKPDLETAQGFLNSGDFLWNSGMFVWRAESIANEIARSLPDLHNDMEMLTATIGTKQEKKVIEDVYSWTHSVSIDYGVMEKAESVYVLEADFDWSDVGSWDEVMKLRQRDENGNSIGDEKLFLHKTTNTVILKPKHKAVAIVGLEDVIVVDTEDALLICKRGHSQDVKHIVDTIKRKQLEEHI
ncbi:MAG: NTP transferase domain-containing protein [Rhizobacter sp.]|nr:NTP transferase domain-containing protein [Chlorobiales bacterium]